VYMLYRRTTKFDLVNTHGKGVVFRGQPRADRRGGAPGPPFLGFQYIDAYTLGRRTIKFDVVW